ncbi:MAG: metallophosphoesterase family protein [Desulfobacterales bacterium]
MRLAVISDIHGNWDAFTAVLADIDAEAPNGVFCLGDSIGYGGEPERVIQELRRRAIASVRGNHEQAVLAPDRLKWFNPLARKSLVRTATMLSAKSQQVLASFPVALSSRGCRFVHGFPPDSVTTYYFEVPDGDRRRIIRSMAEHICFIGHTHDLALITCDGRRLTAAALDAGTVHLRPGQRAVVCAGSVGQPRDGTAEAKYVIWDDAAATIEVRFVRYDIAAAAEKIIAAGLPRAHANRLWCRK